MGLLPQGVTTKESQIPSVISQQARTPLNDRCARRFCVVLTLVASSPGRILACNRVILLAPFCRLRYKNSVLCSEHFR